MDDYGQKYIDSRKEIDPREVLLFKVENKVKNAKMWLFIVGGFSIALALFNFFFRYDQLNVLSTVIDCAIGLVYIGLAFLVNQKPYTAVLTGLILYISTILLLGVLDPTNLASGWLFKIIIIAALVSGLKAAKQALQLRQELGILDIDKDKDVPIDLLN